MTPNIVVYCHIQWIYSASQASECTLTTKCVLWLRHFVYCVFVLQKQIRTNSHTELMCKWYLSAYSCTLKYSFYETFILDMYSSHKCIQFNNQYVRSHYQTVHPCWFLAMLETSFINLELVFECCNSWIQAVYLRCRIYHCA